MCVCVCVRVCVCVCVCVCVLKMLTLLWEYVYNKISNNLIGIHIVDTFLESSTGDSEMIWNKMKKERT